MARIAKPFATEVDLCRAFIAALPRGWTAYAETAGFDILLVRDADGVQIGIEAKLRLNAEVISQALEDGGYWAADRSNPDYRAVLVPENSGGGLGKVADYIGLTVLWMEGPDPYRLQPTFRPPLPAVKDDRYFDDRHWHPWATLKRCQLPEYVPDVAAGASAPTQLTKWKIAALRIEATIELRGFVTRADFKAHGIDHRRWLSKGDGWLVSEGPRLTRGPAFPFFSRQHPRNYDEIKADASKWMPPAELLTEAA